MYYKLIYSLLFFILISACKTTSEKKEQSLSDLKPIKTYTDIKITDEDDYLYPVYRDENHEFGDSIGYVDRNGDTIIPIGKYQMCWTDTVRSFAIVYDEKYTNSEIVAIDRNENILFDVVLFDNFPDEFHEGLVRVKRNGKYGFANQLGQIVIPCQYAFVFSFEQGKAKATFKCEMKSDIDGEHQMPVSDEWIYIDANGNRID